MIIPSKREQSTKKLHSFDFSTRERDSNGIGGIHSMIQTYLDQRIWRVWNMKKKKILSYYSFYHKKFSYII